MKKSKFLYAGVLLLALIVLLIPAVAVTANNDLSEQDKIVPEIIKDVSPSVVAIIGNYRSDDIPAHLEMYNVSTIHGSGVVIAQGEILTNAHVATEMINITIVFSDGSSCPGRLKYSDKETDLAIISVDRDDLQPIKFGDEYDIITGRTVIALGTPVSFSLRNSASLGIVSGLNRGVESAYRLIQTDAAINPGNSGGPLIDLEGELIGINSMGYVGIGIEGMGFAIPVDTVQYVISHFNAYSRVMRPITGMTLEETWEAKIGLPTKQGIIVNTVEDDGPADLAGIQEDDMILIVNGESVHSVVDFNEIMKDVDIGGEIQIQLSRGEQTHDITLKPDF